MANLPSSPFISAAVESAEALPAVVPGTPHYPAGSGPIEPDDISCIGEIFVGARKLNQLPGIFDPAAITGTDELLYVTLKLQDEPGTRDLPCIPDEQAFMDAIEPMPLFLRQAV
jgi:hypothetical protein